ncbi:MAG: DUF6152 family protein [Pseudomonadota bacterium]
MHYFRYFRIHWFLRAALIAIGGAASVPVSAHHSAAMFDHTKQLTIEGTVREFQWTNPHVWIQVMVPNAQGGADEWSVECTSVNFMARRGWNKHTLKAGDKVSITIAPLRDGAHGGAFKAVSSLNGAPLIVEAPE